MALSFQQELLVYDFREPTSLSDQCPLVTQGPGGLTLTELDSLFMS